MVKRELSVITKRKKHVGCRLRKLKKNTNGLRGKGKLTDAKIETLLQNYFDIAICYEKARSKDSW